MNKKKDLAKTLLVAAGGITVILILSTIFTNTFFSLDEVGQAHLSGFFAAVIGIVIVGFRQKFKTEYLEKYGLLMLIIIAVVEGFNLFPSDKLNPIWIVVASIVIVVGWFVHFGLLKILGDEKKIEKMEFYTMLIFFIGLTTIILIAFNIIRVNELIRNYYT